MKVEKTLEVHRIKEYNNKMRCRMRQMGLEMFFSKLLKKIIHKIRKEIKELRRVSKKIRETFSAHKIFCLNLC